MDKKIKIIFTPLNGQISRLNGPIILQEKIENYSDDVIHTECENNEKIR